MGSASVTGTLQTCGCWVGPGSMMLSLVPLLELMDRWRDAVLQTAVITVRAMLKRLHVTEARAMFPDIS